MEAVDTEVLNELTHEASSESVSGDEKQWWGLGESAGVHAKYAL